MVAKGGGERCRLRGDSRVQGTCGLADGCENEMVPREEDWLQAFGGGIPHVCVCSCLVNARVVGWMRVSGFKWGFAMKRMTVSRVSRIVQPRATSSSLVLPV